MPNQIYSIEEIRDIVRDVAQQYGVKRVWLFGAYSRGEARQVVSKKRWCLVCAPMTLR